MTKNKMDDLYLDYARSLGDISILEFSLHEKKRKFDEIKNIITESDDGGYGLEMSAHACKQISERLESLTSENEQIYDVVFNTGKPNTSLLWPSNMKAFIISTIATAREKNEFTIEDSKNGSGKEYHYKIELKSWGTETKKLMFTGIVENFIIKTGYFNWM